MCVHVFAFVFLGNASTTLEGLTLVIFDGQTGAPKTVVRFTDQMFDSAGLFVQAINKVSFWE